MLAEELIKHNKHFSVMLYPNANHSLKSKSSYRRHLYTLINKFFNDNIPPGPK
jgi:hypothetical protein